MGLDVYLEKCADRETARKAEEAHSAFTEELWKGIDYDSATEEQKNDIHRRSEEKARELGITDYSHNTVVGIDTPSAIAPEHLFKLGYFRSSYNEGGIERILRNLSLPTMHDIFGYADEYEFRPDWDRALVKVNEAISGYEAHLNSDAGKYLVTEVRPIWQHGVKTEAEARQLVLNEMRSSGTEYRYFSNSNGEFWLDGLKVVGVVTKKFDPPARSDVIGQIINQPSVFVVYEREPDESGKEDWYLTALKIVRESIQFVISQPDRQDFYLCWSS